jgi:hypothetical protein
VEIVNEAVLGRHILSFGYGLEFLQESIVWYIQESLETIPLLPLHRRLCKQSNKVEIQVMFVYIYLEKVTFVQYCINEHLHECTIPFVQLPQGHVF